VPPKLYGGTERVVSWLSDELVEMGHEVTLFASGDSITNALLEACLPRALREARIFWASVDWAFSANGVGWMLKFGPVIARGPCTSI
jgi:hypothetical protein